MTANPTPERMTPEALAALAAALEIADEYRDCGPPGQEYSSDELDKLRRKAREGLDTLAALAQRVEQDTAYARRIAVAMHRDHYAKTAPEWAPFDDLNGILSQIDNMATGLTRAGRAEVFKEAMHSYHDAASIEYERAEAEKARADALEKDAGRLPELLQKLQELATDFTDYAIHTRHKPAAEAWTYCGNKLGALLTTPSEADDHGR